MGPCMAMPGITGPHPLNALVPHKFQSTREQDHSFQWRVTGLISVFTPSSLFLLGGEVTFSLTPLGEHHPFYLLLWKNSGQLSSQAEMLVHVQWRPGLVSKLIGKKASPFDYRFKASNEADFFFPVSCVSCLNCLEEVSGCSSLSSALTTFGGRRVSDVYSWKDEIIQCKLSRGRDEEAKSGKHSLQGCGSHTVLPRAPGSREIPSGLPGEETREQITTSSQNHHLCFNHCSCDFLLFIWGLLLLLLSCFSHVLTLCEPIEGSPPGSPIPGTLQARTLEWVAISFSLGIHKFHLLKKKSFHCKKNSLKTSDIKNEHRKEQFTKGSADDLPKHKRKEECLQTRKTQKWKFSRGRDRQRHPRLEGKQVHGLQIEEWPVGQLTLWSWQRAEHQAHMAVGEEVS